MRKILKVVGVATVVFAALGVLVWLTARNEDEQFFEDEDYDDYFEDDLDADETEYDDEVIHG